MKFTKQKCTIQVVNMDTLLNKKFVNKTLKRHGKLLPNTIRGIICGPSNCGKTNVMLNLLFSENGLIFENVYVFSKSLVQPKYMLLECVLKSTEIGYFPYSENEDVPPPNSIKPNSIMVFDDVSCGKQNNIKNYFSMGRHNNIDSFYICQTYSFIPKQLVRDNTNFLMVFKQDFKNLHHIYHDHVNTDMTFEKFKDMCFKVWNSSLNEFLVIDKDSVLNNGRYRAGFDNFITL